MGMVVNSPKTEIVLFKKGGPSFELFEVDGEEIRSKETLKALGITFQSNLKWNTHVNETILKASRRLSMIKKITKSFTKEQFLKFATSQIFSQVYYASQVWLNETLTSDLWQKLKALHYRVLRATQRDFKRKIPKATLDRVCKRATPKMWSSYSTASLVIKILRDCSPINIHDQITGNLYSERRKPNRGRFYNNSRGKIGLHELKKG